MSDRVWFATTDYRLFSTFTRNVNSSKFSGFPIRVVEDDGSSVGAGTNYPLGLTADEAMELWWRVRDLELDSDGYISDSPPVNYFSFTDAPLSAHAATREREVCLYPPSGSGLDNGTVAGLTYLILNTAYLFQLSPTNVGMYRVGSTYYPRLDIVATVYVDAAPSQNVLSVSVVPLSSAYYTGSFSGSFGPHTLTYYWSYDDPIGLPYNLSYFDINFLSYWPYAATDGSPIYNTSTGAQLQDPRN